MQLATVILARDAPRSEHDPDLPAAAANLAMRPFRGTFTDASHESAFAAQLFRLAFPAHVLLMALTLAVAIWETLAGMLVAGKPLGVAFLLCPLAEAIGLVGRILLHYQDDWVRGQRWGSRVWMVTTVLSCIAIAWWYAMVPASACPLAKEDFATSLAILAVALCNGSHGMGFLQKLAPMACLLACELYILVLCGEVVLPSTLLDVATACVGTVLAHVAELKMRHNYAERRQLEEIRRRQDQQLLKHRSDQRLLEQRNEQLRKEKDRLDYERRFALHQVGLERSETRGARERATCVGPPSVEVLTSGCGRAVETAQPSAGGGRHVAWTTHPANASDSQCAREGAPVVGILKWARVTTEWSGGTSVSGDSSTTEPEIMHILPTNASLGARMPLPLERPQPNR